MAKDVSAELEKNLLSGIDTSGLSDMLRAAVAESSARLSSQMSVTVNAAAEAQAARSRTNAYQNAAAAVYSNHD